MTDLTNLVNAIVAKRMEAVIPEGEYDVDNAALMESSFRTAVTDVLTIADAMGFLGYSDYLEGFEEGIKVGKQNGEQAKQKLAEIWETVKTTETEDVKAVILEIIEK